MKSKVLIEALEDFAFYGVRHDLNPTKLLRGGDPQWDANEDFWHRYVARMDQYVRQRALQALKEAGVK